MSTYVWTSKLENMGPIGSVTFEMEQLAFSRVDFLFTHIKMVTRCAIIECHPGYHDKCERAEIYGATIE